MRVPAGISTDVNVFLVALSVVVAIVASYAALDLTRRSSDASGWRRRGWIGGGGVMIGAGIWSMHFVGMLAERMTMPGRRVPGMTMPRVTMPVSYDTRLVVLSFVAAVFGASVSLAVVSRPNVSRRGVAAAAAFMGLAVASMHYLGMASMRMSADIRWQPVLVGLSVVIGIVASAAALWLLVRIQASSDGFGLGRRMAAAVLLGFGVAGLHYTAMAAATFTPSTGVHVASGGDGAGAIVGMLVLGAGSMLMVLLVGAAQDQRRAALAGDFAIVANIARELCRTGDTPGRICQAIYDLCGGDLVLLAQPDEHDRLSVTGWAGHPYRADIQDWLSANLSAHPRPEPIVDLLSNPDRPGQGLHQLADGGSFLYEPLQVDGRSVGTLLVQWRDRRRKLPARTTTLISMVAAEGAVALDREELLSKLEWLARRDELTGLLNRRVLGEELDRELATALRHDRPLCVVMLDIDHFKHHNDTHGHAAGDRLLKAAAAGWTAQARNIDIIARYGGEEFVVILPECNLSNAVLVADRLRASLPDGVTCSAGVALLDRSESSAQLINRADSALYHAKANGRNRTSAAHSTTHNDDTSDPDPLPCAPGHNGLIDEAGTGLHQLMRLPRLEPI